MNFDALFTTSRSGSPAKPRQVRLQRIKGGVSGRRFPDGLGLLEDRPLQAAHAGTVRPRARGAIREAITALRDLTRTSSSPTATRARSTPSTAARSRWAPCGSTSSWPEERGAHGSLDHARAARAGAADLPALLVVPREAANREAAVRYIDYIATPEVQPGPSSSASAGTRASTPTRSCPSSARRAASCSSRACPRRTSRAIHADAVKEYHDLITLA